jgi:hypothetical protein
MLKNLVTTAALLSLYQYIKKDWVDTDQYKVGLIDAQGEPIKLEKLTPEQVEVNTKFNKFAYTLKQILDTYPLLKFKFMRTLLNILFVRESVVNNFPVDSFIVGLHEGNIVIIDTNNKALSAIGLFNVYSESGVYTIPVDTILEDSAPITNTTDGVAGYSTQLGDIIRRASIGLKRRKAHRERRLFTIIPGVDDEEDDEDEDTTSNRDQTGTGFESRHDD